MAERNLEEAKVSRERKIREFEGTLHEDKLNYEKNSSD